ncbi:hypothetical protein NFI96_031321 [Prochilodus magdalenae]|nr:hypothetical protein NFI96_031321 [Prochilodus magdalenae]
MIILYLGAAGGTRKREVRESSLQEADSAASFIVPCRVQRCAFGSSSVADEEPAIRQIPYSSSIGLTSLSNLLWSWSSLTTAWT